MGSAIREALKTDLECNISNTEAAFSDQAMESFSYSHLTEQKKVLFMNKTSVRLHYLSLLSADFLGFMIQPSYLVVRKRSLPKSIISPVSALSYSSLLGLDWPIVLSSTSTYRPMIHQIPNPSHFNPENRGKMLLRNTGIQQEVDSPQQHRLLFKLNTVSIEM
jgi:hypothetical protein